MDAMLFHCNVSSNDQEYEAMGGRWLPKKPEPLGVPLETPLVSEMRLMHVDFVEEAYWKRFSATKMAHACKRATIDRCQQRKLNKVADEK